MNAKFSASVFIPGVAHGQGSKDAMRTPSGRVIVKENNPQTKPWRYAVAHEMAQVRPDVPIDGPVAVTLVISIQRPSSHYGAGKNAHVLKPNAPRYPHTSGVDLDKVQRAVGDAGSGIWWRDDKRIVEWTRVVRVWADAFRPVGASITVTEL